MHIRKNTKIGDVLFRWRGKEQLLPAFRHMFPTKFSEFGMQPVKITNPDGQCVYGLVRQAATNMMREHEQNTTVAQGFIVQNPD